MQNRFVKTTLAGLMLAALSLSAQAHRGWLLPSSSNVEAKEAWVTFDGAVTDPLFVFDHVPLRLDGLAVTDPEGVTSPVTGAIVGKFRSTLDQRLAKDGTYRFAIVNTNVMGSYKQGGEVKRFRGAAGTDAVKVPEGATEVTINETHSRLETFVSANGSNTTALKPSGKGLEMVPVTHPTELAAGEPIRMRFQLDGKPLANFPFSMIPGGVRYRGTLGELRFTTDAKGEVSFVVPDANMYLLTAKYPANAEKGRPQPGVASYAYSATLEVLPQ